MMPNGTHIITIQCKNANAKSVTKAPRVCISTKTVSPAKSLQTAFQGNGCKETKILAPQDILKLHNKFSILQNMIEDTVVNAQDFGS